MKRQASSTISIWCGLSDSQADPRTHFWYESAEGLKNRLCDDLVSSGPIQEPHPKRPLLPCKACEQLYVQDMTFGKRVLNYLPLPQLNSTITPRHFMVDSHKIGVSPHNKRMGSMLERPTIGMATFARFYDAPASARERIVREARTFWTDPKGYPQRAYYWALLNTLRQTHWNTKDLSDFENALEEMLERLPNKKGKESRRENYLKVSRSYLTYWAEQEEAQFFKVPPGKLEMQGLTILVNPEVGLRRHGDELALKLWLSAPRPNLAFRQAIPYLMAEAQNQGWQRRLQPALWDVRRRELLPAVRLAKGFERVIRSQAAAFRVHWDELGPEDPMDVQEIVSLLADSN